MIYWYYVRFFFFIAGAQTKSGDDDSVCVAADSTPALGQISTEVIINWDSYASFFYSFLVVDIIEIIIC